MPDDVSINARALVEKIRHIQGPILVIGASGFVGANLMRSMIAVRADVYGTTTRKPAWRLEDLAELERERWNAAVSGTTLAHGDIRADNILLTRNRTIFVDWPWACLAPRPLPGPNCSP